MGKERERFLLEMVDTSFLWLLVMLARRVMLIPLRMITFVLLGRYQEANIECGCMFIRVSRRQPSSSNRKSRKARGTVAPASGSMAITAVSTGALPLDALSSDYERDSMLEPLSAEEAAAIYP